MKRVVFILAISFSLPFSYADDRRIKKNQLTVMTLNTYFMWDGIAPEEGRVSFPWKHSKTEAEEHMKEIADVIIRENPDIINLVEIEGKNALETLNNKFLSGRGYKAYFVKGTDATTGQDLGLLTRVDPEGNSIKRDDGLGRSGTLQKAVSKNYFAKFNINGQKIALVGLHFLARPNDIGRKKKRQAQADLIGKRATKLTDEGYSVIVLGDFNDYDDAILDHIDSRPITNVLWRVKRMKYGDRNDDLINIAQFVPKAERYTAFWDKDQDNHVDEPYEHTSIDHILVSPQLESLIDTVEIPHTLNPTEITDHYPIVLSLKLSEDDINQTLAITRLLPNPPGNENINEEITLKNNSNAPIDLSNFKLRDLSQNTWALSGMLASGDSIIIKRNNQPMALSNRGDTIDLINSSGTVIQSVSYPRVDENEEIFP